MNAAGNLRRQFDLSSRDSLRDATLDALTSFIHSYQSGASNSAEDREIGLDVNLVDIIISYAHPDAQPLRLIEYDMNTDSIVKSSLTRVFHTSEELLDHIVAVRQKLADELCAVRLAAEPVMERASSQYRPAQVSYGLDHRGLIASQHPDWAGFEIESEIWRQWQAVDDSVRHLYFAGARRERVTYEIQLEVAAAAKGSDADRSKWLLRLINSLRYVDFDWDSTPLSEAINRLLTQTSRIQLVVFHSFIPIDRPFPVIISCIEGAEFSAWHPRSSSPINNHSSNHSLTSEWRATDSAEVLLLVTTRTCGYDLVSFQSERSANQWIKMHTEEIVRADISSSNEEETSSNVNDNSVTAATNPYQPISQALPYTLHVGWTRAQRFL